MNLSNLTLEEWLKAPPKDAFKNAGDSTPYSANYEALKAQLNVHHNETTKAAILEGIKAQIEKAHDFQLESMIWLNDHGPKHISTVVERASAILACGDVKLNVREVYILLAAIQFHDVGNFYGRLGHEKKIMYVMAETLPKVAFDSVETLYIKDIAKVHGGKIKGKDGKDDPNTIGTLKNTTTIDGYEIRCRLLAAILRFADEIADDKSRSDLKLLSSGKIPKSSEVFHAYSACLDTVIVKEESKTVELHFKIPKYLLEKKLGKVDHEVYIIDEIHERALKMHTERIYCSKFWNRVIHIDNIWVQIEFYTIPQVTMGLDDEDLFVHDDITYTLHDNQYPSGPSDIYSICPDLKSREGKKFDGEYFHEKLFKVANEA